MSVVSAKPLSWTMKPAIVGPTKLPRAKADIQMPITNNNVVYCVTAVVICNLR